MIFKTFLIISLISIFFSTATAKKIEHIDCDSFILGANEKENLNEFVKKHDLEDVYEARNQNYLTCLKFLVKIHQESSEDNDEFRLVKKGRRPKGFKY